MKGEWGPWIEWHGGAPCPVPVGLYIGVFQRRPGETSSQEGLVTPKIKDAPHWLDTSGSRCWRVERYRILRPRGMEAFDSILRKANQDNPQSEETTTERAECV